MRLILTALLTFVLLGPCRSQSDSVKAAHNYGITLSFPWVNQYHYINYQLNQAKETFGFFGLGISGFYRSGIHKASLNLSLTEDLASPAKINNAIQEDVKSSIECTYMEVLYHRKMIADFSFVGGFNFNTYKFRLSSKIDEVEAYQKTDQTLGASLGVEYRFNKYYSVAAVYRPSLASFEADDEYRHLINLDFRIDLNFKEKR